MNPTQVDEAKVSGKYGPIFVHQVDSRAKRILLEKERYDRMRSQTPDHVSPRGEPAAEDVMFAEAYLNLRTQLADAQKNIFEVNQLFRAGIRMNKELLEQLADAQKMSDLLARALESTEQAIDQRIAVNNKLSMYDPNLGYAKAELEQAIAAYNAHKATRQPTQDKE